MRRSDIVERGRRCRQGAQLRIRRSWTSRAASARYFRGWIVALSRCAHWHIDPSSTKSCKQHTQYTWREWNAAEGCEAIWARRTTRGSSVIKALGLAGPHRNSQSYRIRGRSRIVAYVLCSCAESRGHETEQVQQECRHRRRRRAPFRTRCTFRCPNSGTARRNWNGDKPEIDWATSRRALDQSAPQAPAQS